MATDLFDQLADLEIPPPPPAEFDRNLHQRLNHSITTQHVFDFGMRALPYAGLEMMRALIGFASLTIAGTFPPVADDRKKPER